MTVIGRVDRRVLGAFRSVDAASRQHVQQRVRAASTELDIRRNASGFFVVFDAPGLRDLTTQFDVDATKPWPPPQAFEVWLWPDSYQYLPRRATINMPRKPAPMTDGASSMIPQDVTLFLGSAAVPGVNWAVVRASVKQGNTDTGAPWAVLRLVRDSDSAVLATGMSDRFGEAVVAVPGIGVSSNPNGGGPVVTATVDTTLTAYFDPATLEKLAHDPEWLPNPDDILNDLGNVNLKKSSRAVKIGRGTQSYFKLPIAV